MKGPLTANYESKKSSLFQSTTAYMLSNSSLCKKFMSSNSVSILRQNHLNCKPFERYIFSHPRALAILATFYFTVLWANIKKFYTAAYLEGGPRG